jgi:hypothetical protein
MEQGSNDQISQESGLNPELERSEGSPSWDKYQKDKEFEGDSMKQANAKQQDKLKDPEDHKSEAKKNTLRTNGSNKVLRFKEYFS